MTTSVSREFKPDAPDGIARFVADIPSAVALFDRELRYVAANSAWLSAFGLNGEPILGLRHHEIDPRGGPGLAEMQRRALAGEIVENCEGAESGAGLLLRRSLSARPRRDADGTILGVVAAVHDTAPVIAEKTLLESCDVLTGLAGRHRFMASIRTALTPGRGGRRATAVFLLDIDNFKGINDLYGARVGDTVLKTVASRLLAGTRSRSLSSGGMGRSRRGEGDVVARLGADEFGIVLGGAAPGIADAESFARRLLQLIVDTIIVGEQRVRLTASIGFLTTNPEHITEDAVFRDLDAALQEAKARGPNNAQAWEPALTSTVGQRLAMLDQLRRALDEGEFAMHYQPILRLADNRIVGAEALIRWNHPSDGIIPPNAFLPILEDSGLIVPVGCWVMREVVRQMRIWQMLYGREIVDWISINVSPRQFNDPALLLSTLTEINDGGFPLDRLKIEITESAVMRNPETTRSVLADLHDLGIRVAIDDFGTGYSALGTLRHYTVDTIKLDRGFTSRIDTDDGNELVMAMLRIARVYGADVIAEGIETAVQRDVLQGAGCGFGQGYLFAKPMEGSFFGAFALTHLVQSGGGR
jgi:diguanylate cyclase (GGDEF)-like protein